MTTQLFYKSVLSHFPMTGLRLAFAYGSGVFQQSGHKNMKKNMVDFIFTVDDPKQWHKENLQRNKKHYSFLKYLGPDYLSKIQSDFGAGIYFNTLVKCEDRIIKYGVISTKSLVRDLIEWDTLYVSGRLHKPVYHIVKKLSGENDQLQSALIRNQLSAVHTALLLLPDQFTEEELYRTITGLSYTGDIRMTVGEDRNKVNNIVSPNIIKFRELYSDIIKADEFTEWKDGSEMIEQSLCAQSRYHHLSNLPLQVLHRLTNIRNIDGRHRDVEEVIRDSSHNMEYEETLRLSIADIVKHSSRYQSLKGLYMAGFFKSIVYSGQKLKKMWKSSKS